MIQEDQLLDNLFEISPEFKNFISKEADYFEKERLYFVELGCYAHFLFKKYQNNNLNELKNGLDKLEFLLVNGNERVKKIIKLGFFESFQNILLGENINLDRFLKFLSVKSKKAWYEITAFWDNKKSTST